MVTRQSLARRFREFRLSQAWSLTTVQDELGIHPQTWLKWERGEQKPPAATIVLLLSLEWGAKQNLLEDMVDYVQGNSRWLKVRD